MPISAWVLTLLEGDPGLVATLEALAQDPALILGERAGPRLPLVIDSASVMEDRAKVDFLQGLPGVSMLELVFLDFSDVEGLEDASLRPMGGRGAREAEREERSQ